MRYLIYSEVKGCLNCAYMHNMSTLLVCESEEGGISSYDTSRLSILYHQILDRQTPLHCHKIMYVITKGIHLHAVTVSSHY